MCGTRRSRHLPLPARRISRVSLRSAPAAADQAICISSTACSTATGRACRCWPSRHRSRRRKSPLTRSLSMDALAFLAPAAPVRLHDLVSEAMTHRRRQMLRAFKLYTAADNASHVPEGTIDETDRTDVIAIHLKETPAHSSYDWHPDPEPQY